MKIRTLSLVSCFSLAAVNLIAGQSVDAYVAAMMIISSMGELK